MNMDAPIYQEILVTFLFPYLAENFHMTDTILHQDNDPKHSSFLCKTTLSNAGVKWLKAPAQSPDLNPIEMLWHSMFEHIRKKFCKTPFEVDMAVLEFQKKITPEICQNYINKLKEIIPVIIKKKGGWSNY